MSYNASQPQAPLEPLERHLARVFVKCQVHSRELCLALSGGRDSVGLAAGLSRVAPLFKCTTRWIHVIHRGDPTKNRDRDQAYEFCKSFSQKLGVELVVLEAKVEGEDEAHLRKARHLALRGVLNTASREILVFAHHQDDLLETRLMRLLRGTGPLGLRAMKIYGNGIFRPLLEIGRSEIARYLESKNWSWWEDPSNEIPDPMRNWLRLHWLKTLDQRDSSARRNLAASLERLALALDQEKSSHFRRIMIEQKQTWGVTLECLAQKESKFLGILAQYCLIVGIEEYRESHLREIHKRLRSADGFLPFSLLGRQWTTQGGCLVALDL